MNTRLVLHPAQRSTGAKTRFLAHAEESVNQPKYSGRGEYEIVVKGHLDEERSYWFEGLTMITGLGDDGTPITTFTGHLVDQAALHGVLAKIRDMNLPLISVTQVEPSSEDES